MEFSKYSSISQITKNGLMELVLTLGDGSMYVVDIKFVFDALTSSLHCGKE